MSYKEPDDDVFVPDDEMPPPPPASPLEVLQPVRVDHNIFLGDKSTKLRKAAMVMALEKTLGVASRACMVVGIHRDTHYQWKKDDPEYLAQVTSISDLALDFVESKMFNLIKENDVAATIFYMKCKGRERGYIDRVEVDNNVTGSVKISVGYDDDEDE